MGRFCRETGQDCYPKFLLLEEYSKLVKAVSVSSRKAIASTIMDSFLDESAFAPSPADTTDCTMFVDLGKVDESKLTLLGGSGTNPCGFDGSCETYTDAEDSVRVAKKKGELKIGPFENIAKAMYAYIGQKFYPDFKKSQYFQKFVKFESWYSGHNFSEMDFEIFRVLGRGGFGLVNGCRDMRTGKVYAMKTMDKRRVKLNGGEQMCIFEKELLDCCNSRFVLDLKVSLLLLSNLVSFRVFFFSSTLLFCISRLCSCTSLTPKCLSLAEKFLNISVFIL